MLRVTLRFYGELNDFLLPDRRQRLVELSLGRRASVKDLIESLGVPHPEVDLVLADGEPIGFGHLARDGERIAVYPAFRSLDVAEVSLVRPPPLPEARFLLDGHLGKLAVGLRMLGFDAAYSAEADDADLARASAEQGRILLTRDRGLLKRGIVAHGYLVRGDDPEHQLTEVLARLDLADKARPFRRCLRCNGTLEPVEKAAVLDRLEPKTRRYYHEFRICRGCGRIYWKGSHHGRMERRVRDLLRGHGAPDHPA